MSETNNLLRKLNRVRSSAGYAPLDCLPKGLPKNSEGCVIAEALKDIAPHISVGTEYISGVNGAFAAIILEEFGVKLNPCDNSIELDARTIRFINNFDEDMYPQLLKQ